MIQRPRLLVIDDDPLLQRLLVTLLRKEFFVSAVSNGIDGLARATANLPDLIILDLQMPGWDGIQTLKALRQVPKLQSVPILILSAGSKKEVAVEAKGFGADDYLIKNETLRELLLPRVQGLMKRRVSAELQERALAHAVRQPTAPASTRLAELCKNIEDGF